MRLMIVGSLQGQLSTATKIAMARGAKVNHALDAEEGLRQLRNGLSVDLIMVDIRAGVKSFIQQLEAEHIHVAVAACGVENDANAAADAIRAGALEYIPLPPDAEMIAAVLAAVSRDQHALVVEDLAMKQVINLARQVSPSDASILVGGESGTGKEVIARFLHENSKRAQGPFVSVNCGAIPENLLESELFGHEKGAFTGAVARRIGRFEEAQGGTLLLDEVSEMDFRLQVKLLRALQERVIDRVGGSKPVPVDIRIIATTNKEMTELVRAGQFREDLFFRLNVIHITIPPLRKRPKDVIALAKHFIGKYCSTNGLPEKSLDHLAEATLKSHLWPGNVRELENCMHRAVLLSSGAFITEEDLQLDIPSANTQAAGLQAAATAAQVASDITRSLVGQTVAQVEQELIISTLDHCLGNRTHAANILGISIRTLRNKLRAYAEEGISVPLA